MKIQFGEKGEVSWDALLETLEAEETHATSQRPNSCIGRVRRHWCFSSLLMLMIVLTAVSLTQLWLLLRFFIAWETVPATHIVFTDEMGNVRHVHFSWTNCGSQTDPVQLKQLQVNPDPLLINGNISLTLNANLDLYLDSPISVTVKVERRLAWVWLKIPCIDNLGSCHYEDVCELTPFIAPDPCPDPFPRFKLPCRCPVTKGNYHVKEGVFSVPSISKYIPSWLVSGDYYIHGTAQKDGHSLGCYNLYVSISK